MSTDPAKAEEKYLDAEKDYKSAGDDLKAAEMRDNATTAAANIPPPPPPDIFNPPSESESPSNPDGSSGSPGSSDEDPSDPDTPSGSSDEDEDEVGPLAPEKGGMFPALCVHSEC